LLKINPFELPPKVANPKPAISEKKTIEIPNDVDTKLLYLSTVLFSNSL
jgi:hypothetical protein